jgi:hypothetical protein
MDERIRSVLDAAFPDREVRRVEAAEPSWNDDNETVRVDFADGDDAGAGTDTDAVYLKIAADGDASRVVRERAVMEYVGRRSDVPVPTVLASDTGSEVPYLATAPMEGQRRLELWYVDAHGHVVGGDADGLDLDAGSWTDVLVERVERMRAIAGEGRFDHHFDEVIAAVEAERDLLDDAPAALVHGDPAHPNCIHRRERVEGDGGADRDGVGDAVPVGFLDWEIAHVGDPARELRRTCRLQFGPLLSRGSDRLVAALHEGYRDRAGSLPAGFEARRPVYDAVSFLGASGFFEKWEHRFDEPTEELAERVQSRMEARLAEIR